MKCLICKNKFEFDDSPAHRLCKRCYEISTRAAYDEPVYIDALGIAWTKADLEKAGGQAEVDRLCREARR